PWEGSGGRVWLDRFLIDEKHQGYGYGKQTLHLLVATLFDTYRCDEIFLSIYETNQLASHLYDEFGFAYNGELYLHKEKIMVLQKETYLSRFGPL
ncbi:MAG: GNAT family N-acetyltransferase, partial [Pygmaiobacter massiliensis]